MTETTEHNSLFDSLDDEPFDYRNPNINQVEKDYLERECSETFFHQQMAALEQFFEGES